MDIKEQYAYLKPQPFVWLAVLGSGVVHLAFIGIIVIGGIMDESHVPLSQKAIVTRLVRKGKKLPENWLPHKPAKPVAAKKPPKSIAPKNNAKKTPATKPAPKARTVKKVDYTAQMDNILSNLEKEEKKTRYEQEGSEDGVAEGDALVKQKGDEYLTKVYRAVKSKYSVPELIPARERLLLQADVVLFLDRSGNIKSLKLVRASGNQLYDNAVVGAIKKAAPFPSPPDELVEVYSKEGIEIPFRASKM